jgi:hypothetical protein
LWQHVVHTEESRTKELVHHYRTNPIKLKRCIVSWTITNRLNGWYIIFVKRDSSAAGQPDVVRNSLKTLFFSKLNPVELNDSTKNLPFCLSNIFVIWCCEWRKGEPKVLCKGKCVRRKKGYIKVTELGVMLMDWWTRSEHSTLTDTARFLATFRLIASIKL